MTKILKDVLLQLTDIPTPAGNIYPADVMQKAVDKNNNKPLMGTFSGAVDIKKPEDTLLIPLDKVTHQVENLKVANGGVIGDVTILNTPQGLIAQELLAKDVKISFGLRAYVHYKNGNCLPNGSPRTVSDCQIISFSICNDETKQIKRNFGYISPVRTLVGEILTGDMLKEKYNDKYF